MSKDCTLKIFPVDGASTGLLTAEVVNVTGLVIPGLRRAIGGSNQSYGQWAAGQVAMAQQTGATVTSETSA
jgi:hypothetical protein